MADVRVLQRICLCPFDPYELKQPRVPAFVPVVDNLLHRVPSIWITFQHPTAFQLSLLPFPSAFILMALQPAVHR